MATVQRRILCRHVHNALALAGLVVCAYGLLLEVFKDTDPTFHPFCDISETVSCTKAMMSRWGRGFGLVEYFLGANHALNLRNPTYGIFFYASLLAIGLLIEDWLSTVAFCLVVVSNLLSVYLAYVLFYHVKTVCIVCLTIYAINFALLVDLMAYRAAVSTLRRKKRR